ncbi:hypothetical protein D6851_03595 [Altericroceibacterium spongiae]|uniref:Uncharacterized protein n=1 Tax=Altericroceibacterium spongiae TaxID=2320269 RepID=A0A420ENM7_9SPHN|nr:hypothetical protein [Altericroceibacterium spongiae]RKF22335.1 hypothetical protein D6851_03595 [Altericroceibacterium spongiae]
MEKGFHHFRLKESLPESTVLQLRKNDGLHCWTARLKDGHASELSRVIPHTAFQIMVSNDKTSWQQAATHRIADFTVLMEKGLQALLAIHQARGEIRPAARALWDELEVECALLNDMTADHDPAPPDRRRA